MGNSGHPGAGGGKPRSHKSHRGIFLFYFQPCFLRHKGLQIRCISEAYLNISLLIQEEQKPSNLLRSIHQEPYLLLSQFGSWLLLLGASRHQLPLFPLCAAAQRSPRPPCGHRLPATSAMASALHCTACRGSRAVLLHALQPASILMGLRLCCFATAHHLHPPHTHTESGMGDTAMARAEHTDSAWPQE